MHNALLIAALVLGQADSPTLRQGHAPEGVGSYVNISAGDIRDFTVEQVYGFATGAIGEKRPLRSQIKSFIKSELARMGIELFTTDADLERFIDFSFAATSKFGLYWTALTDPVSIGDATFDGSYHKSVVASRIASQEAARTIIPLLEKKRGELDAQYRALEPQTKELKIRADALDKGYTHLLADTQTLSSSMRQRQEQVEERSKEYNRLVASNAIELKQLNDEATAVRDMVATHTRLKDSAIVYLKTLMQENDSDFEFRKALAKQIDHLAMTGKVEDEAWVLNRCRLSNQGINIYAAKIAVASLDLNERRKAFAAHSAELGKFKEDKFAIDAKDIAIVAQSMRENEQLTQHRVAFDRRKSELLDEQRSLSKKKQALAVALERIDDLIKLFGPNTLRDPFASSSNFGQANTDTDMRPSSSVPFPGTENQYRPVRRSPLSGARIDGANPYRPSSDRQDPHRPVQPSPPPEARSDGRNPYRP